MITLTRRVHESFLINSDIRVTVVHLRDQRVRLQVDAPSDVQVRCERHDPPEAAPAESAAAKMP